MVFIFNEFYQIIFSTFSKNLPTMRYILGLLFILLLVPSKAQEKQKTLKEGVYRAWLEARDNQEIPFNFKVNSEKNITIFNGEEKIEVDEIRYVKDSIYINFPVFEGYVAALFQGENLIGKFINKTRKRVAPFHAEYQNSTRFIRKSESNQNINGIWETIFSPGTRGAYIAKGIFNQENGKVTGTFRTTTGDYRYLEGIMDGDSLKLSAFDGAHAFLFAAKVTDSVMSGEFYAGNHWSEPFVAKRNTTYELPNEYELTFLKEGFEEITFEFPDVNNKMVSLKDKRFKNKVVVVQVMGTWCTNSLDSSRFYKKFYDEYKNKDLEVVALAVEFVKTPEKAFDNIKRLRKGVGMEYPILLAQYGSASKSKMLEKLPMLNEVISYPTSIIIDKKGKVRRIQTGFNGPGTGKKFTEFKREFRNYIDTLLRE